MITGGQCSSACVLPWAAGLIKFANVGTCFGVHNANFDVAVLAKTVPDALAKETRKNIEGTANLAMAEWLWDHGAPGIVTAKIFHTRAASLYCLTAKDLAAWNVRITP